MEKARPDAAELVTRIAVAWLDNPSHSIAAEEVPALLRRIQRGLAAIGAAEKPAEDYIPAVSVQDSLASKDHIVSMIDGKPYRGLTKHLAAHGLTPDQYRARYRLHPSYPMVAPTYSARRQELAKEMGLGQMRKRRRPGTNEGRG